MPSDPDQNTNGQAEKPTDVELTAEQEDALVIDRNVAITAGAGTGKTTTLTKRYVQILESNPESTPKDIVTITFTRKAAAELRSRVRKEVYKKLAAADSDDTHTRWRTVLNDLEEGYIHTIHAFCARILRENAVQAPVPMGFDVLDEDAAAGLQRDVVVDHLEMEDPDIEQLTQLFSDRDWLVNILVGLLKKRPDSEGWLEAWRDAEPTTYEAFLWEHACSLTQSQARAIVGHPDVTGALDDVSRLAEAELAVESGASGVDVCEEIDSVVTRLENSSSEHLAQRLCRGLYDSLEKSDGGLYASASHHLIGTKATWNDETEAYSTCKRALNTLLEHIQDHEDAILTTPGPAAKTSAQYLPALVRTFERLCETYEVEKASREALDYPDLIQTTVSVLQADEQVRAYVKESFESVMVDEFQDTDSRQWDVVRLITALSEPDRPADNVFLVGDEKQSIYGFRGADITTFGRARGELGLQNDVLGRATFSRKGETKEATALKLSGNFRTAPNTLAFLNELFDYVFQAEEDTHTEYEAPPQRLSYERDTVFDDEIQGTAEYMVVPDDADDSRSLLGGGHTVMTGLAEHTVEGEARAVANRIASLLNEEVHIYDEESATLRAVEPEDIAILLRRRTHLDRYQRALHQCEVPFTVVSGRGFYDTPEIQALINLLRVLADSSDTISLYGVLRSPLFGFTDTELATLAHSEPDALWDALASTNAKILNDAYALLQEWREVAGCTAGETTPIPWNRLLTRVFDETGYLTSVAADERGQQAVANVEKFRDEVRTWAEEGIRTPASLLRRIDRQAELDIEDGEAEIPAGAAGVRIMTIHAAKGQEFPVVVVPELGTGLNYGRSIDRRGTVQLVTDHDQPPFLALPGPNPSDPFSVETTVAHEYAETVSLPRERAEARRVLYVACTRVRDHLILSGTHSMDELDGEIGFGSPNEFDEAKQWADWVQPQLLEQSGVRSGLSTEQSVTARIGDAFYTVRFPPRFERWEDNSTLDTATPGIELPATPVREPRRRLSPTQLVQHGYDSEGDDEEHERVLSSRSDSSELERRHFGTIVHKIAELETPLNEREGAIHRLAAKMGFDISNETYSQLTDHVEDAIACLERQAETYPDGQVYKELRVLTAVDDSVIVGDIDHLLVTSDAFVITDYKTNRISASKTAELAEHYLPQMMCYAIALHEHDSDKEVHVNLRFTEPEITETTVWSAEDIDDIWECVRELVDKVGE
ncbi:UvrD-helicase domain-containing protein [Salinigranum halophilum]|uniref:UvrD-helicase domain-containing protein n=1 Tax=Salinigranum halophilum TaxID=2565931 RepID=UPI0010A7DCC4|nr:UvrD-helicase domain-containing protein [Salinigranum halophilum]